MVEDLAKGAQLLVGEMMLADQIIAQLQAKNPHMTPERIAMMGQHLQSHHLSPEQLGDLAARAGVTHLVAVHIPLDNITPETAPDYAVRISQVFSGQITIAKDLDHF
jgi:ribonuclease BN (tRNA processing enzyme)